MSELSPFIRPRPNFALTNRTMAQTKDLELRACVEWRTLYNVAAVGVLLAEWRLLAHCSAGGKSFILKGIEEASPKIAIQASRTARGDAQSRLSCSSEQLIRLSKPWINDSTSSQLGYQCNFYTIMLSISRFYSLLFPVAYAFLEGREAKGDMGLQDKACKAAAIMLE